MKKVILSALALLSISASGAQEVKGKIESFDFGEFKAHVYTSTEAMGDVSIMVEGEKGLVILEPQSFYKSIEDFNNFAKTLSKPIVKVVANYHAGGLSCYNKRDIVMVEPMIEFMQSPKAQGMMNRFSKVFNGAMDTQSVKIKKSIPAESTQQWAGVTFDFTKGVAHDFPASSVNIGGKLFYTHFAPNKMHPKPMQIGSRQGVENTLAELIKAAQSGCELFVGSHGTIATKSDVEFMIEYYTTIKQLLAECDNSDLFSQRLFITYSDLAGEENIKAIAKTLYPDQKKDAEYEAVVAKTQEYLDFMSRSTFDIDAAKALWLNSDKVSLISPAGHFFGVESITGGFMQNIFKLFASHKLTSICNSVNIFGDSANVQIYWKFDTVNHEGKTGQTRGRESLIFEKVNGEWLLVHIHYSRLP